MLRTKGKGKWLAKRQKNFQKATELFNQGLNISAISRELNIRRQTLRAWLKQDSYAEGRGWQKDKKRKHTDAEQQRIVLLKEKRNNDCYLVSAPYVQMDYAKQFPLEPLPSEWFIQEVSRKAGLQSLEPKAKKKKQNIVSRLLFPIKSIVGLGKVQQSCDFVGKKYIAGRTEPVSIFATAFYQWLKLYRIWRVYRETADAATERLADFYRNFPLPDVMRMDNGMTFRGTGRIDGHIGKFLKFLLNLNIIPLFSAPYQSYTNPHIEGHNRTFNDKLWQKNFFTAESEIDRECNRLNAESQEFFEWKFKERLSGIGIRRLNTKSILDSDILRSTKGKKICFVRFVESWKETDDTPGVAVLDRFVELPAAYLNQYVFVILNLESSRLLVISEHQGIINQIINRRFEYTV